MSKGNKDNKPAAEKPAGTSSVETQPVTASPAETAPAAEGTIVPAGSPPPVRSTALVLASANIKLATPKEMEDYDLQIRQKFEALSSLVGEMTGEVKDGLLELTEQANPVKEGMEELEMRRGTEIPRINICQPTSNKQSKPEAVRPGDLYTDNGVMLMRPFEFVPIYFYEEHVNFPRTVESSGVQGSRCQVRNAIRHSLRRWCGAEALRVPPVRQAERGAGRPEAGKLFRAGDGGGDHQGSAQSVRHPLRQDVLPCRTGPGAHGARSDQAVEAIVSPRHREEDGQRHWAVGSLLRSEDRAHGKG